MKYFFTFSWQLKTLPKKTSVKTLIKIKKKTPKTFQITGNFTSLIRYDFHFLKAYISQNKPVSSEEKFFKTWALAKNNIYSFLTLGHYFFTLMLSVSAMNKPHFNKKNLPHV